MIDLSVLFCDVSLPGDTGWLHNIIVDLALSADDWTITSVTFCAPGGGRHTIDPRCRTGSGPWLAMYDLVRDELARLINAHEDVEAAFQFDPIREYGTYDSRAL